MSDENILNDYKEAARSIKGVEVSRDTLILEYLNETKETFAFDDLKKTTIITTDEGPFLDDVFWLMMFKVIIMIPQGIPGEDLLLERMQQFPGFNNENFVEAMCCSENNAFHVWERDH